MTTTPVRTLPTLATTDGATVYTSYGRSITISRRLGMPLEAGLIAEACSRNDIRQLWFTAGAGFELAEHGDHYGWDFQPGAAEAAWVHTFKTGTSLTVDLVRPQLDANSPWHDAPDAQSLLNGLRLYRDLVGVTYHHSPAATSGDLLIDLHHGHKKNVPLDTPAMPPPALMANCETPLAWIADPVTCRLMAPRKWLHALDKNGAYLGAASNLALGAGTPERVTCNDADRKLPGYFLVDVLVEPGIPSMQPARKYTPTRWVTTPTLAYLTERYGKAPAVHEAYVWLDHHQPLQPWYKRLRDARAALLAGVQTPDSRMALAAVKLSYSALLGGYLSSTAWDRSTNKPELYRPDIRHMVIATARSNLVRTARKCQDAGAMPLALSGVDTLYFLSDWSDPINMVPECIQIGTGLHQYKVKWSVPMTDALRAAISDASIPDSGRLAALGALRSEALA